MAELRWTTHRSTETLYRVGVGVTDHVAAWLAPLPDRVPVVADREVWRLHGGRLRSALGDCEPLVLLVDGEADKELAAVERLVAALVEHRVHRRMKLICFGGGACCDIAGMLAMVYMRGMGYAIVATSLMAQVDAAIGGKVGCNFGPRKNLLGGFHHPELVLLDPAFLETLPARELRAGLAEAVKLGVLLPDLDLLSLVEEVGEDDRSKVSLLLNRCLAGKLRLLDPDPFEQDLDRLLNLGHAVAHALEKVAGSAVLHGEAVAIGLAATARYASREGHCTEEHAERIIGVLQRLGLPTASTVDPVQLSIRLGEIPDHRGGALRLVVPCGDAGARVLDAGDLDALVRCVSPPDGRP